MAMFPNILSKKNLIFISLPFQINKFDALMHRILPKKRSNIFDFMVQNVSKILGDE